MLLTDIAKDYSLDSLLDELSEVIKTETSDYFRRTVELPSFLNRHHEVWRFYHTEAHVCDMLLKILPILPQIKSTDRRVQIVRSIIYHDIYWAPGFGLNEFYSAQIAQNSSAPSLTTRTIDVVAQHIRATKDHAVPVDAFEPEDTALVIDLDLSRLGAPFEEFQNDRKLIFKELSSSFENKKDLTKGIREWAQKFLDEHEKIYVTSHFAHLEKQAQENLVWTANQY